MKVLQVVALCAAAMCFGQTKVSQETPDPKVVARLMEIERRLTRQGNVQPTENWDPTIFHFGRHARWAAEKGTPEFKQFAEDLNDQYARGDYRRCIATAERMAKIWPEAGMLPQSDVLPWIGELRMVSGDYAGAMRDFNESLSDLSSEPPSDYFHSSRHINAAWNRGHLYRLLGNAAQARADFVLAKKLSRPPMCGMRILGWEDRNRLMDEAIADLTLVGEEKLLNVALRGYLSPEHRHDYADETATLILAERYVRAGKIELAKLAFRAAAAEKNSDEAKTAASRLKMISAP